MTNLHRSITPRTLHLQRRDTPERTGTGSSATAVSTVRANGSTMRRVVVPLNAVPAAESARASASASETVNGHAAAAGQPANRPALLSADGGVTSENLLRGAKVVSILHNGESYQLRATRHGKLILTK
ncbi:MAG: hemin uptake protein HemP [Janthinobacterium lividum]